MQHILSLHNSSEEHYTLVVESTGEA